MTKSFDQNLSKILKLQDDTIIRTQEDKMNFVRFLMEKIRKSSYPNTFGMESIHFIKYMKNETIRG